jgi:hypothetical protein
MKFIISEEQFNALRESPDRLGNKLGSTPQAKFDFAKKRGMGEETEPMEEDIILPVSTGDTIMMGKFKNKKTVVKTIGKDDYSMPTINGKKAATFRIPKKVQEDVDVIGMDDGGWGHLAEVESADVDLSSFDVRKTLYPKIWYDNKILNKRVRLRLLKIADDFLEDIGITPEYAKDTLFLGSLTNYNWSKYSDIDLHILVDFKEINDDVELVKEYFNAKRKEWNDEHDSLRIYGFPVELYVQDTSETNASESAFSLEKNKWIKTPIEGNKEILDREKVKRKAADIMTRIDELEEEYEEESSIDELENISIKVKNLYDKIKRIRKDGLATPENEYSTGNIVFKILRRTEYMGKLIDLKSKTYDKINTIK